MFTWQTAIMALSGSIWRKVKYSEYRRETSLSNNAQHTTSCDNKSTNKIMFVNIGSRSVIESQKWSWRLTSAKSISSAKCTTDFGYLEQYLHKNGTRQGKTECWQLDGLWIRYCINWQTIFTRGFFTSQAYKGVKYTLYTSIGAST